MTASAAYKQFSFRLPEDLVDSVEECAEKIRARGLEVSRADVVRLLLTHAIEATKCKLDRLLKSPASRRSMRRT